MKYFISSNQKTQTKVVGEQKGEYIHCNMMCHIAAISNRDISYPIPFKQMKTNGFRSV